MWEGLVDRMSAAQPAFVSRLPIASTRVVASDLCDYQVTQQFSFSCLVDQVQYGSRPIYYLTFRYPVQHSDGSIKVSLPLDHDSLRL